MWKPIVAIFVALTIKRISNPIIIRIIDRLLNDDYEQMIEFWEFLKYFKQKVKFGEILSFDEMIIELNDNISHLDIMEINGPQKYARNTYL